MAKGLPLTETEVTSHKFKRWHKSLFNDYCEKYNLDKSELKILDYGHGKGISVAMWRELGYQA